MFDYVIPVEMPQGFKPNEGHSVACTPKRRSNTQGGVQVCFLDYVLSIGNGSSARDDFTLNLQ